MIGILAGIGLVLLALGLIGLALSSPRRRALRRSAAAPSPIEDMVATKKLIREDEASRWIASWMYVTGDTDKFAIYREMRERSYAAEKRIREAEYAEQRRRREEADAERAAARAAARRAS